MAGCYNPCCVFVREGGGFNIFFRYFYLLTETLGNDQNDPINFTCAHVL